MNRLVLVLLILFVSGTGCTPAQSLPEATLKPIAGKFAFAPELCSDSMGIVISEHRIVDHNKTMEWSDLDFSHVSLWWLEKHEAAKELAYTAIASSAKNRTIVSVFIVVSEQQLRKSGIEVHPNARRPIIAYAAFETDGDFDIDELANRIRKPDDSGLFFPCE